VPNGARLVETAPGITVKQVLTHTAANLIVPDHVPTMAI
jgi:acyl CoA:acetate/3-ketoacid CoA transferase beta subunit